MRQSTRGVDKGLRGIVRRTESEHQCVRVQVFEVFQVFQVFLICWSLERSIRRLLYNQIFPLGGWVEVAAQGVQI